MPKIFPAGGADGWSIPRRGLSSVEGRPRFLHAMAAEETGRQGFALIERAAEAKPVEIPTSTAEDFREGLH